jgi:threonine/homoserine/homoserine lactone efflux protein
MSSSVFVLSALFAFLAAVSPGPDFALVSKNSLFFSRKVGIYTAVGIAFGLAMHILYALLGFSVLIKESVLFYNIIKYVGAIYLAFLGCQLLLSCLKQEQKVSVIDQGQVALGREVGISSTKAVFSGFLCNALNPKASLFILSFFSQIIDQGTSPTGQVLVGIEILAITFIWFAFLASVFSHKAVTGKFLKFQKYLSFFMGLFLLSFSLKLAFF